MEFQLSNCIAIQTHDFNEASAFYQKVFGLKARTTAPEEVEFDTSPIRLFLGNSENVSGPVLEFLVRDLEAARAFLEQRGCTALEWQGKGKPCYMRDPFGLQFNLYQE